MDKIVLDNVTIHVFPTEFGKVKYILCAFPRSLLCYHVICKASINTLQIGTRTGYMKNQLNVPEMSYAL